jgi:GTP1/Obg family GTP-binding protein
MKIKDRRKYNMAFLGSYVIFLIELIDYAFYFELWKCQRMWKKIKKAFIFKIYFLILQSDFQTTKSRLNSLKSWI